MQLPARVWRQALAGLTEATPPTEAGTIHAPTLIIGSELDELLPRANGDALATMVPGPRLVVHPNTGQLLLWEQPARIASDLTAFLTHLL
jgi:pimeloyl-ACP methyl ester carboxylesterase